MTPANSAHSPPPRWLDWSKRAGDIGIGAAIILVVLMMIVPLSPPLIDLLIGFNLAFSALLLALSLFMSRPLGFSSFPTLLLTATLYRLALNISSTRLILLRADAGRIIEGFGVYVVGGDILVGAVIFGILAMVLFLVITKGAERVAEVSARFSLDALPGMQMAVDSDLKAGAISPTEASRRRSSLEETSRYFGALDGAMKFVRGDAVASLVIVFVNITGGIAVGMIRHGMSAAEALHTYGRLTVGDGLVTMIPALLISTAAGLLVTRVARSNRSVRLGEEINRQLRAEPRATAAAAILLGALSLMPGLPAWPFLVPAVLLGTVAAVRFKRERQRSMFSDAGEDPLEEVDTDAVVIIELGSDLYKRFSAEEGSREPRREIAAAVNKVLSLELGFVDTRCLPVVTDINGSDVAVLRLKNTVRAQLTAAGASPSLPRLIDSARRLIRRNAACLVGMDETQRLLDIISRSRPATVRETVPKRLSLPTLSELLGRLLEDNIPLTVLPEVLEIAARAPESVSPTDLLEHVREGLAPVITRTVQGGRPQIRAFMLDRELESVLEGGIVKTSGPPRIALSKSDISMVLGALRAAVGDTSEVLITSPHLRFPLAQLLKPELPNLRILKASELLPETQVDIVETVAV